MTTLPNTSDHASDPSLASILVSIIVAQALNRGIGKDNQLLWHISEDLKYFKAQTVGKPIIMGRKTFESIGRALPGRLNIVLTRNTTWSFEGVSVCHTVQDALVLAKTQAQKDTVQEVMVIGGAHLYKEMLPAADKLYVTQVDLTPEADAFFPEIDLKVWNKIASEGMMSAKGIGLTFEQYDRN